MRKMLPYKLVPATIFLLITIIPILPASAASDLERAAVSGDIEKLLALINSGEEVKGPQGGEALSFAALKGKFEAVKILVEHGADVNAQNRFDSSTPLTRAVSYYSDKPPSGSVTDPPMDIALATNKLKIAELLILHGAKVHFKDYRGPSPLDLAATGAIAELLIKHGASVHGDLVGSHSWPLLHAVAKGREEVTKVLIAHGANVNYQRGSIDSPLYIAVSNNRKEIVQLLVSKGADVNIKTHDGQSILEAAILYADRNSRSNITLVTQKEILQILINSGADINSKNRDGRTPLVAALDNNKIDLAILLLKQGAKVNEIVSKKYGRTDLFSAMRLGNIPLVDLMIKNGASVNAMDNNESTPLHEALWYKQYELAEFLIKHGAEVNISGNGAPLLHHHAHSIESLKLLLKYGANANGKNKYGDTLLWKVCYDSKLSKLLLDHGADINIKNSEGRTVLHLASRFARDKVVKWLLEHGADISAKDDYYGQTPLFHAVRSYERHFEIYQILNLVTRILLQENLFLSLLCKQVNLLNLLL